MKSTEYGPPLLQSGFTRPSSGVALERCAVDLRPGEQFVGSETALGLPVFHYTSVKDVSNMGANGAASLTQERWRWQGLDCLAIREKDVFKDQAGRVTATSERRPVSITIGDPDPELFDLGEGYAEVKPSDFMIGLVRLDASHRGDSAAAANPPVPASGRQGWEAMDKRYLESQQFKR
jgi:hypothetical protein